jgi:hypothetical protein
VLPSAETACMLFWALASLRPDHVATGRRMGRLARRTGSATA